MSKNQQRKPNHVIVESPWWAEEFFETKVNPTTGKNVNIRVAYGGRAAGKSWEFARQLLKRAAAKPLRVLCTRELQKSIKDSVHKVLKDQMTAIGLESNFDAGETYLRSNVGAEFLYKGLRHNTQEIKSTEGIDICWVEEAQLTTADSWKFLIPTILGRKPGAEIWVSFNVDDESDATYQDFVVTQRDNSIVMKINYDDNPFVSKDTLAEKNYMKSVDYDSYLNIWEGFPRKHTDAQIFKNKFEVSTFEPQPSWEGPFFGIDWGFSKDPTTMVKCWVSNNTLYIEEEAYELEVEIDKLPALFQTVSESADNISYADSARPETISYLKRHGFPHIKAVDKWKGSVEDGIEYIRQFMRVVIHPDCPNTTQEFRLYSFKVDKQTEEVLPDVVDKNNHLIDAIRYALSPKIKRKGGISIKRIAGMF